MKFQLEESACRYMEQTGLNKVSMYNVVCFGFMPWGNMWKRNQSMMAELAKLDFIRKLIFVNPRISLRSKLSDQVNPVHGEGVIRTIFPKTINSKIMVYTPMTWLPCKQYFPMLMEIEDDITLRVIQFLTRRQPYILFLNCPNFSSDTVLDELIKNASLTCFDFSDDFPELGYDKLTQEMFRRHSMKYAHKVDLVLTVNEHIKQKYADVNANMHVVRNATNYENFDRSWFEPVEKLEVMKKSGRPIIGYSGIANLGRIDSAVLDYLIANRPLWEFVFVGPSHSGFTERYSMRGNVHIFPPVGYQDLPNYLRYFDVAIVPFKINENTKGNDLLKLHDYLSMGKPVVSTNIGGAVDLKEAIQIAQNPEQFLMNIEALLVNSDGEHVLAERKRVAIKNSWRARIVELEALVKRNLEDSRGMA